MGALRLEGRDEGCVLSQEGGRKLAALSLLGLMKCAVCNRLAFDLPWMSIAMESS